MKISINGQPLKQILLGIVIFVISQIFSSVMVRFIFLLVFGYGFMSMQLRFGLIEPIIITFKLTASMVVTLLGITYIDRKKLDITIPILSIIFFNIIWGIGWYILNYAHF